MTSEAMNYHLNGEQHSMPSPLTVLQLIEQQQMEGQRVLVVINDEVVPKTNWSETQIEAGDKVDIMSPITGG
jgi:sulfur carrier protein